MTKVLLPHRPGTYAAFPTAAVHGNQLHVFYRVGRAGRSGIHGHAGVVRRISFALDALLTALDDPDREDLSSLGQDLEIFAEHNEMDAIFSPLRGDLFALATRYFADGSMHTFLSFSDEPRFTKRREIIVPGLDWLAFYGKGLSVGSELIFSAYGALNGQRHAHPVLVMPGRDRELGSWRLAAVLPSNFRVDGKPVVLNESTLVFFRGKFHLFMRRDSHPFGIWHAHSDDLHHWRDPEPLLPRAHAPMAIVKGDRLWLTYRNIIDQEKAAIAVIEPFGDARPRNIDVYEGSPYDGGYGDLVVAGDRLLLIYYHGNPEGEPYLKVSELSAG